MISWLIAVGAPPELSTPLMLLWELLTVLAIWWAWLGCIPPAVGDRGGAGCCSEDDWPDNEVKEDCNNNEDDDDDDIDNKDEVDVEDASAGMLVAEEPPEDKFGVEVKVARDNGVML